MKQSLFSVVLIAALLSPFGATQRGVSDLAPSGQLASQFAPATQSRYTITDLGTLGSTSRAYGINDEGQVVGMSYLPGGNPHAFLWEDGTMTDLGTLGGYGSEARDINDAGQIVGMASTPSISNRAFLRQNGAMQDLGTLGGNGSDAFGINNSGQVVGFSGMPIGPSHAFLWQNGSMQDLGDFGTGAVAYGINDAGQVVGDSCYPTVSPCRAFLWQGSSLQDLGHLGGDHSRAYAINEAGQVVGESHTGNGEIHPFLWQNGAMQDLGTLSGPGSNDSHAFDINDKGQVVGTSAYHAFLWENSQMQDLNNLIPANSGWVLYVARAINNKDQIVGYGGINGQIHAFLLTPRHRRPVLIVPGIAGTYSASVSNDVGWLLQRGIHPTALQVDPLGHVYDAIIRTFKNLGYVEGKDLFVVNYDWRLMPGPMDGTFDGHISGLNAQALSDDQFNYAVDYLGWYLRKAAEAYRAKYGVELDEVDIIAHSTGGLVTRTYIQSDAYGGVYDAGNNYSLPAIGQFVMVGVPNRGASKAWNPLHDNWIADFTYRVVLSKIINRAYQKALAGRVIQGPDYNIDRASITVNGKPSPTLFIEKYVPTVRALLATYDFIDFGSGYVNLNQDPAHSNDMVLDLNAGLDLNLAGDPNSFASQTKATVICGASGLTANQVVDRTGTAANDVLLPFTDFLANDAGVNDAWYEDLWLANDGDTTVPLESCQGQFVGDARIDIFGFSNGGNTSGATDHTGLMSNFDVQDAILNAFDINHAPGDIATATGLSLLNVVSVISDPVGTILVDGEGRRLGYSQTEGALTEIPGSVWFGEYDGFGFINGDVVEPLHLELTGRGEDFYVMVSVERNGKPVAGVVKSGYLDVGSQMYIPVTGAEPSNQSPTVNAGGSYMAYENTPITMSGATASDPDLDSLTYSWSVDSTLCSFDDAGTLNPSLTCSDIGNFTATLTVSDSVNPPVTNGAAVTVIYDWTSKFLPPVKNFPTLNRVKAGGAVPIKFSLSGYQGLNIFAAGYPKSEQIVCGSTDPVNGLTETISAGSSGLSYDPSTDQYKYVWKTDKSWAGTCRQLVIKLVDGTLHRANFKFKRRMNGAGLIIMRDELKKSESK